MTKTIIFAVVFLLACGSAASISEASNEFNRRLWASGTMLTIVGLMFGAVAVVLGVAFL